MKPTNKAPPSSARAIESCRRLPVVAAAALHTLLSLLSSRRCPVCASTVPPPHLVMRPTGLAPRTASPGRRHQRKLVGDEHARRRRLATLEEAW